MSIGGSASSIAPATGVSQLGATTNLWIQPKAIAVGANRYLGTIQTWNGGAATACGTRSGQVYHTPPCCLALGGCATGVGVFRAYATSPIFYAVAGTVYTMSEWIQADPSYGAITCGMQSGVTVLATVASNTAIAGWQRIQTTFRPTATASLILQLVQATTQGTAGAPLYVDNVQIELGSTASEYCDGNLSGAYAWAATAALATISTAAGAGSIAAGLYYAAVTAVTAQGESFPWCSPAQVSATGGASTITVTPVAIAGWTVTGYNIYLQRSGDTGWVKQNVPSTAPFVFSTYTAGSAALPTADTSGLAGRPWTSVSVRAAASAGTPTTPPAGVSSTYNDLTVYGMLSLQDGIRGLNKAYVNVLDYGALGDGATDDTAAILAAQAATPSAGTLYFPARTYLFLSQLTVTCYWLGDGPNASVLKYGGANVNNLMFYLGQPGGIDATNVASAATGATATATIAGGAVTGFTNLVGGSGYGTNVPLVAIYGGGGTGATATATLTGGVVSALNLVSGGSGYTSVPTVVIGSRYSAVTQACSAVLLGGTRWNSGLVNIGIIGPANPTGWTHGRQTIPCGVNYTASAALVNVSIQAFDAALVLQSPAGHFVWDSLQLGGNWYGVYAVTDGGDGWLMRSEFTGNVLAGYACHSQCGILTCMQRVTISSSIYMFYQEFNSTNQPVTTSTQVGNLVHTGNPWMNGCRWWIVHGEFLYCGAFYSEIAALDLYGANPALNGVSNGVAMTAQGTGYTSVPAVSFTGVTFTTAPAANALIDNYGHVTGIVVTNPGAGLSGTPTVVIGGPGTGAAATATVSGGALVPVYTPAPSVTTSGGLIGCYWEQTGGGGAPAVGTNVYGRPFDYAMVVGTIQSLSADVPWAGQALGGAWTACLYVGTPAAGGIDLRWAYVPGLTASAVTAALVSYGGGVQIKEVPGALVRGVITFAAGTSTATPPQFSVTIPNRALSGLLVNAGTPAKVTGLNSPAPYGTPAATNPWAADTSILNIVLVPLVTTASTPGGLKSPFTLAVTSLSCTQAGYSVNAGTLAITQTTNPTTSFAIQLNVTPGDAGLVSGNLASELRVSWAISQ